MLRVGFSTSCQLGRRACRVQNLYDITTAARAWMASSRGCKRWTSSCRRSTCQAFSNSMRQWGEDETLGVALHQSLRHMDLKGVLFRPKRTDTQEVYRRCRKSANRVTWRHLSATRRLCQLAWPAYKHPEVGGIWGIYAMYKFVRTSYSIYSRMAVIGCFLCKPKGRFVG